MQKYFELNEVLYTPEEAQRVQGLLGAGFKKPAQALVRGVLKAQPARRNPPAKRRHHKKK